MKYSKYSHFGVICNHSTTIYSALDLDVQKQKIMEDLEAGVKGQIQPKDSHPKPLVPIIDTSPFLVCKQSLALKQGSKIQSELPKDSEPIIFY